MEKRENQTGQPFFPGEGETKNQPMAANSPSSERKMVPEVEELSGWQRFIANTFAPLVQTIIQQQLIKLFQKFSESNHEQYEASMITGHVFIKPLINWAETTKTELDDGFVEMLNMAITMSAMNNGVEFPAALPTAEQIVAMSKNLSSIKESDKEVPSIGPGS